MKEGFPSRLIMIGGGQEYYGPTAARDKQIVTQTASELFNLVGNSVTVVTGGMPGIGMDFTDAWIRCGGKHVQFIVSEEYQRTLTETKEGVEYVIKGTTQSERRQALLELPGLECALFVQGGQYTTDEILKSEKRGIRTICFVGSGGASAGLIPYKGESWVPDPTYPEWIRNTDPNADVVVIARKLANIMSDL
jgi:hypothetical protein